MTSINGLGGLGKDPIQGGSDVQFGASPLISCFASPAEGGGGSATWVALMHAMNYDRDLADAREQAAMQARNEKHANKLKSFDEQQVPPSFNSAAGGRVTQKQTPNKESLTDFVRRYS